MEALSIFNRCFHGTPATINSNSDMVKMTAVVEKSAGSISTNVKAIAPSGYLKLLNSERSRGFANHLESQTSRANEANAEV